MSGIVSGSIDAAARIIGRYPYQFMAGFAAGAVLAGLLGWGDGLAILASASSLLLIWKHESENPRSAELDEGQAS